MITLICTKCKASLEMDDAFAGGVCRCQFCGTIQTVPAHLKGGAGSTKQKALYSTRASSGAGLPSSGLDELANVVASSGLSNTVSGPPAATTVRPRAVARPVGVSRPTVRQPVGTPLSSLAIVVICVLLIVGAGAAMTWYLVSRGSGQPGNETAPASVQPVEPVKPKLKSPNFLDIPLEGQKVIYLLDRGDANKGVFDPLKAALFESLETLGSDHDFQVLFWTRPAAPPPEPRPDPTEYAYPKHSTAKANADRVEECRSTFEDLSTGGRTDPMLSLSLALEQKPNIVIFATAKGETLGPEVARQVQEAVSGSRVVIHTIDLSSGGEGKATLQPIALGTGGVYKHVKPADLQGR